MLIPLILSPNLFNFEAIDEDHRINYLYELKDFFDKSFYRGALLFDNAGVITSYIQQNIESISSVKTKTKVKKLIQVYFEKFKKSGKMINIKVRNPLELPGMTPECAHIISLALQEKTSYVIYNNEINCGINADCGKCMSAQSEIYPHRLFNVFNIDALELDRTSISLIPTAIPLIEFENKIMKPIFRFARIMEIYDRQITGENRDPRILVRDGHKKNLIYWFKILKKLNPLTELTIYSMINENQTKDENNLRKLAIEFEKELIRETEINLKLYILREKNIKTNEYASALHNRYIFTDRISLACDRGLDLLKFGATDTLRDFHMSVVHRDDTVNIKRYIQSLERL
jgi:hypothetical protein